MGNPSAQPFAFGGIKVFCTKLSSFLKRFSYFWSILWLRSLMGTGVLAAEQCWVGTGPPPPHLCQRCLLGHVPLQSFRVGLPGDESVVSAEKMWGFSFFVFVSALCQTIRVVMAGRSIGLALLHPKGFDPGSHGTCPLLPGARAGQCSQGCWR